MAAITDRFTQATLNSRPTPTTVTSIRAAFGTTLQCLALTGWPTTTAVHFITYKINTAGLKIAGSQIDWKGIVSGTTITGIALQAGTDSGNAVGDVVEAAPTAAYANDLVTGLTNQHNQDGTHGVVTATSIASAGVINASTVSSLQDAGTPLSTYRSNYGFDFVASGGVWSGDAYGSSLNASMTAIVCYTNGQRLSVNAIAGRTYTASKDTYVDILNTAGVGSVVYTEVANNATSPALAANSIRIAIIVSGANIVNVGSINQGQETILLPIVSSIIYSVTDGLGNLICSRDSNRKTLGYRRITGSVSTSVTSATQVIGLSAPVIVPAGRKVKITINAQAFYNGTSTNNYFEIWDGVVGSGTVLASHQVGGTPVLGAVTFGFSTPSTTSKTYNASFYCTAGTVNIQATAVAPAQILVELV